MAKIGQATVEIGDYLRRDDTGWEGVVTEVDGTEITVEMNVGGDYTAQVTEFHYNVWDSKYEASGKKPPEINLPPMTAT